MDFDVELSIEILSRTPAILKAWLLGLPDPWVVSNQGEATWSPFDVVGHLIHGERTDWIPRARLILGGQGIQEFEPFDRYAQFQESQGKTLEQLLATFAELRGENLAVLRGFNLRPSDLELVGVHPELGTVTLSQLLATWVVHDLDHLGQIAEVMAGQYAHAVGPWKAYLGILGR